MKQIDLNEEENFIAAKVDNKIYAVSSKCSHFGFNLSNGILFGEILYCPLHLAAFNIKTGEIENGPSFNGI